MTEQAQSSPDPALATTRDARISFIRAEMAALRWPSYPDALPHRERLAEIWGLHEKTVRSYAGEAHRSLALDPDERAELQERLGRSLLEMAEEARASKNKVTDLPDYPSAIRAIEAAARFLGIEFEQKVKLSGSVALEDLDELRKRIDESAPDARQPATTVSPNHGDRK